MRIIMQACPSEEDIVRFVERALSSESMCELERHFDSCSACLAVMAATANTMEPHASAPTQVSLGYTDSGARPPDHFLTAAVPDDHARLLEVDPSHYHLVGLLAKGGMGRILHARDRRLGREVAIKELLVERADLRVRFEREARITARLTHPSIVHIHEAGVWPDGRAFYAMRFVRGRSLAEAIKNTPRKQRMQLLLHLIPAVDAMAYAHSMQVIHRDLKPDNVLVGEFGETVVIDWGLAKDLLRRDEEPEAPGVARLSTAAVRTEVGQVLGTVAYMPPEQAEGRQVDARADVYALGAMLYHILTGAPPFTGRTNEEIKAAVLNSEPAPLDAGVPRDLAAIVRVAMARDASTRFPSARELADDLKRFQTGQMVASRQYSVLQSVGHFARKHRVVVGLVGLFLVFLSVGAAMSIRRIVRENERTMIAQREAELGRAAGKDLIDSLLLELRSRLETVGRLDVFEGLGQRILRYYRTVGEDSLAGIEHRADALLMLGDVELKKGDLVRVRELVGVASELSLHLTLRSPGTQSEGLAARVHYFLGLLDERSGDSSSALRHYGNARALLEEIVRRVPDDPRWLAALGKSNEVAGSTALDQRQFAQSLELLTSARKLYERVIALRPDDTTTAYDLMRVVLLTGNAQEQDGDLGAAEAAFRQVLELAKDRPQHPPSLTITSTAHGYLGGVALARHDERTALSERALAVRSSQDAVAIEPRNRDFQRNLSIDLVALSDTQAETGNGEDALRSMEEAKTIRAELVAKDGTNEQWRRDLGVVNDKLGRLYLQLRDFAAARRELAESLAGAEHQLAIAPEDDALKRDLGMAHDALGDVDMGEADPAAALARYHPALTIARQLADKHPDDQDLHRELAESFRKVGTAQLALQDRDGALDAFQKCHQIISGLVRVVRDNPALQEDLASCLQSLGDAHVARHESAPALASYREALRLRDVQATEGSDYVRRVALARTCLALVRLRPLDARALAERGLSMLRGRLLPEGNALRRDLEEIRAALR